MVKSVVKKKSTECHKCTLQESWLGLEWVGCYLEKPPWRSDNQAETSTWWWRKPHSRGSSLWRLCGKKGLSNLRKAKVAALKWARGRGEKAREVAEAKLNMALYVMIKMLDLPENNTSHWRVCIQYPMLPQLK